MGNELIGKQKERMPVLYDLKDPKEGEILLCESGIVVRAGDSFQSPFNYVESITVGRRLNLGKMEAYMVAYDVMGGKHTLEFAINESYLHALKKACGK